MGSDIFSKIPHVIESSLLLEVLLITEISKLEEIVGCAILEERAANVDFTDPGVLDNSVSHFGLHGFVEFELSHESQSVKVLRVRLLEHQADLLRLIDIVQQCNHTIDKLVFELKDSKSSEWKVALDLCTDVEYRSSYKAWIDILDENSMHLVRFFNKVLKVGD